MFCLSGKTFTTITAAFFLGAPTDELLCYSDGIARVHGMNNVQAEELVE